MDSRSTLWVESPRLTEGQMQWAAGEGQSAWLR